MLLRRAEKRDIPRIGELLLQVNNVHAEGRPDLFIPNRRKYTDTQLEMILKDENLPVYVAEDESGTVRGYSFCQLEDIPAGGNLVARRHCYIDDICVDQCMRRKGFGKALYQYTVDQARLMGCYHVTLNVWTLNKEAMAFYQACGMKPLKTVMEVIL